MSVPLLHRCINTVSNRALLTERAFFCSVNEKVLVGFNFISIWRLFLWFPHHFLQKALIGSLLLSPGEIAFIKHNIDLSCSINGRCWQLFAGSENRLLSLFLFGFCLFSLSLSLYIPLTSPIFFLNLLSHFHSVIVSFSPLAFFYFYFFAVALMELPVQKLIIFHSSLSSLHLTVIILSLSHYVTHSRRREEKEGWRKTRGSRERKSGCNNLSLHLKRKKYLNYWAVKEGSRQHSGRNDKKRGERQVRELLKCL